MQNVRGFSPWSFPPAVFTGEVLDFCLYEYNDGQRVKGPIEVGVPRLIKIIIDAIPKSIPYTSTTVCIHEFINCSVNSRCTKVADFLYVKLLDGARFLTAWISLRDC